MRQQITTPIVRRLVGRNHAHRFAFYGQTSGFASNHRGQGLLGEGVLFSGALLLLGSGFCGRLRCRNPGVAISAQFFFFLFFLLLLSRTDLLALAFRILYSACQKVGFGVAQQDGAPTRDGSRALREDFRTN